MYTYSFNDICLYSFSCWMTQKFAIRQSICPLPYRVFSDHLTWTTWNAVWNMLELIKQASYMYSYRFQWAKRPATTTHILTHLPPYFSNRVCLHTNHYSFDNKYQQLMNTAYIFELCHTQFLLQFCLHSCSVCKSLLPIVSLTGLYICACCHHCIQLYILTAINKISFWIFLPYQKSGSCSKGLLV